MSRIRAASIIAASPANVSDRCLRPNHLFCSAPVSCEIDQMASGFFRALELPAFRYFPVFCAKFGSPIPRRTQHGLRAMPGQSSAPEHLNHPLDNSYKIPPAQWRDPGKRPTFTRRRSRELCYPRPARLDHRTLTGGHG